LNKKENKAGAYPSDPISICVGVRKITIERKKIIKEYFFEIILNK
tara:strand:- start:92 stop:226 length:135 start_codon:yes stop_codon:yes gene_type:complete